MALSSIPHREMTAAVALNQGAEEADRGPAFGATPLPADRIFR